LSAGANEAAKIRLPRKRKRNHFVASWSAMRKRRPIRRPSGRHQRAASGRAGAMRLVVQAVSILEFRHGGEDWTAEIHLDVLGHLEGIVPVLQE